MSRQALQPIYPPIQWTPRDLSQDTKHISGRLGNIPSTMNKLLCSEFVTEFLCPCNKNVRLVNTGSFNIEGNDCDNDDNYKSASDVDNDNKKVKLPCIGLDRP
jgi:hypothetical protein